MTEAASRSKQRWGVSVVLLVCAVFYGLGFVHPRADFPNFSPWSDWAKMTDEGWYGSAAIQHFLQGSWYLPGAFNPVVAMPVWPVMLGGWFAITGVSMASARVLTMLLYGASLVLLYLVVKRERTELAAAIAVLITVANPFCYAFNRLAVLEPVTVFWMMLALWLAGNMKRVQVWRLVLLGLVVCLLVLTKPTGVALVPAVLYLVWASLGWPRRAGGSAGWFLPLATVAGVAVVLWLAYFSVLVKPHYMADYKLLFNINAYRVHLTIVPKMAWVTLRDGLWISPVLFPLAALMVLASLVWLRQVRRSPLFGASVIAIAGHLAYVGYHTNFQPRYYEVIALPLSAIVVLGGAAVWDRRVRWASGLIAVVFVGAIVTMGATTLDYVLHPEYSFLVTAQSVAAVIEADKSARPLLLADSGADISLFTGIPAICESYSTLGLDGLLQQYQPGWYAAWPGWDDEQIRQMGDRYRLREVARYQVFDDPRRNVFVLYKLTPKQAAPVNR
jgi:4-amino-4-deoxy-L-arabinose transferase-like glycosyltransferase